MTEENYNNNIVFPNNNSDEDLLKSVDNSIISNTNFVEESEEVAPAVPVPISADLAPGLQFPDLGNPSFTKKEKVLTFSDPHSCNFCKKSVIEEEGPIFNSVNNFLDGLVKNIFKTDRRDPRVEQKQSSANTLIGFPAEPPHVSLEVINIIPNLAADLVQKVANNILLAAGSTSGHIGAILAGLKARADALGDEAAKAMGNGLSAIITNADAIKNMASGASAGVWSSLNQAVAMLPIRQIPTGIWHPLSVRAPELEWFNDSQLQGKWPLNGFKANPLDMLNNGVNILKDAANSTGALCLLSSSCSLFSQCCDALSKNLGVEAWGMQLEGMIRNFSINNVAVNNSTVLNHTLKHWVEIKNEGSPGQRTAGSLDNSSNSLFSKIDQILNSVFMGAFPGNLLYASIGGTGTATDLQSLSNVAPKIASSLGSPYANSIKKYTSDPDESYDDLGKDLPDLFKAGDPRMQKLLATLEAIQSVIIYINSLFPGEVADLQIHTSEMGGDFVYFIQNVKNKIPELGVLTKISSNFIHNKLSFAGSDLILDITRSWSELTTNINLINDPKRKLIATTVLSPKESLGAGDLSLTLTDSKDILNGFGGTIGPEVASAASVHAGLTRALLVANSSDTEANKYKRTQKILEDANTNAEVMTYGGTIKQYVKDVHAAAKQNVGFEGLARAGLPAMAASASETTKEMQRVSAAIGTMVTQQNGKNLPDLHQPINDIHHKDENKDTLNYALATQKHAAAAAENIITKSVPHIAATSRNLLEIDQGLPSSTKAEFKNAMASHMERLIQESANGLATASVEKITGTKLNQTFEGQVNQSKFMLNQAGHMLTNDAAFMRNTARMMVSQGSIHLTEADAHQTRAKWSYSVAQQSMGFATTEYQLAATGTSLAMAKEVKMHSQEGIQFADKKHITQVVGPAGNQVEVKLGDDGKYHVFANSEIVLHVGGSKMIIGPNRIDLNPIGVTPPVIAPTNILQASIPAIETTSDKSVSLLPATPGRNPIPVASPYNNPETEGGFVDL